MTQPFDAIILGAGAAGLMCAIEAGKRGRRVAVLELADRPGKKILISGGGRCNFTNIHCRPENFLSANPHFAKSALARYTPEHFLALIKKHNIAYHEKTLGQLFCDHSSRQILDMLLAECADAGVEIIVGTRTEQVEHAGRFTLCTSKGIFNSPALAVATGGLSIPKMGATSFGYDIARQFGINIVPTRPALVPLTLSSEDCTKLRDLTGVSTEVIASIGRQRFREKLLITHRGLSGPAILQISSYWTRSKSLELDLAPEKQLFTPMLSTSAGRDATRAASLLRDTMPQRLADRLITLAAPASWTNHAIQQLETKFHRWPVTPSGTEGYDKAEVTAGGIDTNELSSTTMECKRIPGLYFIGEVVDVTGHLGGFNFQWAWASGAAAGRSL
ncbi:NAD(P)/FAD-dependent oxidoreductase [Alloacidobacterium dinghuense]|uniref:NAD(P)/FAD-dependent oxidoreductase n=1 Tax=Alloacidobacterium dinghuense TaxID=2763107 RepID=A0A7G8BGU8_9BACT|nr:NAD(P)/FAD-dependent oxidoreductase [Alloacidobacterium dinghuense]QNI31768.1 NAD(P)/FAD-dependent oxidoreductase [Alloacidobacterium dinghuense]